MCLKIKFILFLKTKMTTPQVITLNDRNSIEILVQYTEVVQKAGVFLLAESDLLKRARDLLLNGIEDGEMNEVNAKQLLIQAIQKGQSKGTFSLDDAYILHRVCNYVAQNINNPIERTNVNVENTVNNENVENTLNNENDELEELSDPVPLKISKPRIL